MDADLILIFQSVFIHDEVVFLFPFFQEFEICFISCIFIEEVVNIIVDFFERDIAFADDFDKLKDIVAIAIVMDNFAQLTGCFELDRCIDNDSRVRTLAAVYLKAMFEEVFFLGIIIIGMDDQERFKIRTVLQLFHDVVCFIFCF